MYLPPQHARQLTGGDKRDISPQHITSWDGRMAGGEIYGPQHLRSEQLEPLYDHVAITTMVYGSLCTITTTTSCSICAHVSLAKYHDMV